MYLFIAMFIIKMIFFMADELIFIADELFFFYIIADELFS